MVMKLEISQCKLFVTLNSLRVHINDLTFVCLGLSLKGDAVGRFCDNLITELLFIAWHSEIHWRIAVLAGALTLQGAPIKISYLCNRSTFLHQIYNYTEKD